MMKRNILILIIFIAFSFVLGASDYKPLVTTSKCTGCSECDAVCPVNAITVVNDKACINPDTCIGCLACVRVCSWKAVK